MAPVFAIVILGGLGIALSLLGLRSLRRAGLIANTATSKVRSVAIGFAELIGKATGETTIPARFSGRPCYYYHCEVERYVTTTDSKGNSHSSWRTQWTDERSTPFALDDGTGTMRVEPERAEFNVAPDKRWYLKRGSRFTIGRWKAHVGSLDAFGAGAVEIPVTQRGRSITGDYRFTERVIEPNEAVYALGTVARDDAGMKLTLDRQHGPFILSDRSEKAVLGRSRLAGWAMLVLGVAMLAGTAWLLFGA